MVLAKTILHPVCSLCYLPGGLLYSAILVSAVANLILTWLVKVLWNTMSLVQTARFPLYKMFPRFYCQPTNLLICTRYLIKIYNCKVQKNNFSPINQNNYHSNETGHTLNNLLLHVQVIKPGQKLKKILLGKLLCRVFFMIQHVMYQTMKLLIISPSLKPR